MQLSSALTSDIILDDDLCLKFEFWRRVYTSDLYRRGIMPEDGAGSYRQFAGSPTKLVMIPYDINDYLVAPWKWVSLPFGKIFATLTQFYPNPR